MKAIALIIMALLITPAAMGMATMTAEEAAEEQVAITAMLVERYPLDQYEVSVTPIPAHPLKTNVHEFRVRVAMLDDGFPLHGLFHTEEEVREVVERMEILEALGAEQVLYNGLAKHDGLCPELQCIFQGTWMIWQGSEFPESYVFNCSVDAERGLSEEDVAEVLPGGFTFLLESGLTIFSPPFLLPETAEELAEIKSSFNKELDEQRIIPELRF